MTKKIRLDYNDKNNQDADKTKENNCTKINKKSHSSPKFLNSPTRSSNRTIIIYLN